MRSIPALILGLLLLGACAPDSSGATPIAVELANDHVTLNPTGVAAGLLVFDADNVSTDLVHEIEIFANATAGAILPVNNTVADTTGLDLVEEIENVVPGTSASLTVHLSPGTYLVMCNLPGHYALGMWAYLTVTG